MKTKKWKGVSNSQIDYKPFYGVLIVFLAWFNIFDTISTTIVVGHSHGTEMNPIMDWLISKGIGWFIAVKLIIGGVGLTLLWKFVDEGRPKIRIAVWFLFVLYSTVVINNSISMAILAYFELS